MIDPSEWPALAKPDPEWEQSVQDLFGGYAFDVEDIPSIEVLRSMLVPGGKAALAALGDAPDDMTEEIIDIPVRDGNTISARLHKPKISPSGGSPLYVMIHGGGFCVASSEAEIASSRALVQSLDMTVVNIDYRLAPEHPFPTAAHDSWDATKWAAANASHLGADPSRGVIVGGTSSGANLAAVVAHLARDESLQPPITGVHLKIPTICWEAFIPDRYKALCTSYEQNRNAPVLPVKAIDLFMDNYCPKEADRANPLYSPLLFPTGHSNLPPTYLQVAGMDPLRDQALLFEKILREEESILTKLDVYPGQPHGFNSTAPGQQASRRYNNDAIQGVKWLLSQHK